MGQACQDARSEHRFWYADVATQGTNCVIGRPNELEHQQKACACNPSAQNAYFVQYRRRLHPVRPSTVVAIHQPVLLELRAFGVNYVPVLAAAVLNPLLLHLVEVIEARRERVVKTLNVALWMQCPPWFNACAAFA